MRAGLNTVSQRNENPGDSDQGFSLSLRGPGLNPRPSDYELLAGGVGWCRSMPESAVYQGFRCIGLMTDACG